MLLSVAIIARDEERHIAGALQSARPVADEIVVLLDPRTRDRTAAICAEHGARVVAAPFVSFPAQRNRALAEAGYWIPRFNTYWGRALRGGGWYPDHQLRLLRRDVARYDEERLVHELVILDGPAAYLSQHLLHINIESWGELRRKQHRYALAEAATLNRAGVRFRPRNLLLQPPRAVWRRLVTWRGYRDRGLGLLLALVLGWYEAVMYAALWRMQRRAGRR